MARIISYRNIKSSLITEAEHKALLKRFDVKQAKLKMLYWGEEWSIYGQCPFCNQRNRSCTSCPVVKLCVSGCWEPLWLGDFDIHWNRDNNKEARKKLKTIRAVLLRAKKVPYVRRPK